MSDQDPRKQEVSEREPGQASAGARKLFRAALFFAGSAAFGGLAVALWDRKTLTAMRRREADTPQPSRNPSSNRDREVYPDEDVY